MTEQVVFKVNTAIVDSEVEAVRELIGQPLRLPPPFNREATLDTIRHYALGIGDDNPLWCDEQYGAASAYGSVIAPPTWLYSTFAAGIGPGFGGLQSFHAGGTWHWLQVVRPGDRILPEAVLTDVQRKQGKRSGEMLIQIGEVTYRNQRGEVVATHEGRRFRVPRRAKGGLSYEPKPPYQYSDEEMTAIEDAVVAQTRWGTEPRPWEDVEVGEALPDRVKGPLDSATMIAYYAGNLQAMYKSADLAIKWRRFVRDHPGEVPNARPIEWQLETTPPGMGHHDARVAQAVGMPNTYDNGWMRLGWMSQVVTDWMGDTGFLTDLDISVRLPNVIGDTLWAHGEVTAKRISGEEHLVDIRLWADRQDGALSCDGTATARLPSRSG
jgi:acyl dehydratase